MQHWDVGWKVGAWALVGNVQKWGSGKWVDTGGTRLAAGSRWEWAGNGLEMAGNRRIGHGQAWALVRQHCHDRKWGRSVRKWVEWADMGRTGLVAGSRWEWAGNRQE